MSPDSYDTKPDRLPPAQRPLLAAAWRAWLCLRNELPARCPTEVEAGVWVGGIPAQRRWRSLAAAGVRRVVGLMAELPPPPWLRSADVLLWLPVPDGQGLKVEQFRAGCAFLDADRSLQGGTLVYCGSGLGRAPTLYVGWCVWRHMELADVVERLGRKRPIVRLTNAQLAALDVWGSHLSDGRERL